MLKWLVATKVGELAVLPSEEGYREENEVMENSKKGITMTENPMQECLNLIEDLEFRKEITEVLKIVPESFWIVPSSSTGTHHPKDEVCDGGTILHTRRVVKVVNDLCHAFNLVKENGYERDNLIASAILHDSCTRGLDGIREHSTRTHDVLVRTLLSNHELLSERMAYVCDLVEQHMGRWSTKDFEVTIESGLLLHLADYIASRNYVKVSVDG